jgi:hypothetical protein
MHLSKSIVLLALTAFSTRVAGASIYAADYNLAAKDSLEKRDFNHWRRLSKRQRGSRTGGDGGGGGGSASCLAPGAFQTGSSQTGQSGEIAAGQIESAV